jgi:thymidylate synthase (FAD)
LEDTGNQAFIQQYRQALELGLSPAECLVSFYAKLCYASLSPGKNDNIDRTRDIPANLAACLAHGHGSVFGHVNFNFVITNCSRVFTHELVRHHVGTEYSQTSGRYVRTDKLKVVWDPILEPIKHDIELTLEYLEMKYRMACEDMNLNDPKQSFDYKKKVTSALRRMFLPNGVANEIGFSMNVRAARHMIQAPPLFPLENPGIVSIPLGFLGAFIGTLCGNEPESEEKFAEMEVRANTGLGAEKATAH